MEKNLDFAEYLISKNIDSTKFSLADEKKFKELENIFSQMHPDSFTAQKLFLINPLRRKYYLNEEIVEQPTVTKIKIKPKFK